MDFYLFLTFIVFIYSAKSIQKHREQLRNIHTCKLTPVCAGSVNCKVRRTLQFTLPVDQYTTTVYRDQYTLVPVHYYRGTVLSTVPRYLSTYSLVALSMVSTRYKHCVARLVARQRGAGRGARGQGNYNVLVCTDDPWHSLLTARIGFPGTISLLTLTNMSVCATGTHRHQIHKKKTILFIFKAKTK